MTEPRRYARTRRVNEKPATDMNDPQGVRVEYRPSPWSEGAEQAVFSCMMDSAKAIDVISGILVPDDFYRPEHGRLYRHLLVRHASGKPTEFVALVEDLWALSEAQQAELGGVSYIMSLIGKAPSTANAAFYADLVKEQAHRRRLLARLNDASDKLLEDRDTEALAQRDRLVSDLLMISPDRRVGWRTFDRIATSLDAIVAEAEAAGKPRGCTSGFAAVDERFGLMLPGQLVILGARPAMGKTALVLDIAERVARREGTVGLFSLEMKAEELAARSVSKRTAISARKLLEGRTRGHEQEVDDAFAEIRKLSIVIDDRSGITIGDVRTRARALKSAHPDLSLIVLDYLQLLTGDDPRQPREQVVAEASRGLKTLAKDLDVPVIALAQLNRGVHDRKDPRPVLADLRESGSIEQDADRVLFIHRQSYYFPDDQKVRRDGAELICAKNRGGAQGTVDLRWDAERTTFHDETRQEVLLGRRT